MNFVLSFVYGLLTATGFGSADFIAKLSTTKVGYLRTALFMQAIGSCFILPFSFGAIPLLFNHPIAALEGILIGVLNAIATVCLYKGFEVGRVSIVSPIASTAPVVAILLAVSLLREMITSELLLAITLVITGIILVSLQIGENSVSKKMAKGTAYALGFMLSGGVMLFALKPVSLILGPFLPVLLMRWVGVPLLGIPFLAARHDHMMRNASWPIFAIALFDTFANVTYTLGVSYGTVTIVSPLGGMFSAVTVFLAWLILKERLGRHQLVGFLCLLIGVGLLATAG